MPIKGDVFFMCVINRIAHINYILYNIYTLAPPTTCGIYQACRRGCVVAPPLFVFNATERKRESERKMSAGSKRMRLAPPSPFQLDDSGSAIELSPVKSALELPMYSLSETDFDRHYTQNPLRSPADWMGVQVSPRPWKGTMWIWYSCM